MNQIVFATGNEGKVKEVKMIMRDLGMEVISLKEAGIIANVEENGVTFEENAILKAKEIAEHTNAIVLADDSGLEIDFLNKEPGIYSARYLGEDTSYAIKNKVILERMEGADDKARSARFVCAMAAVFPDGEVVVSRGVMEGMIGYEIQGENGFGYDPIFYLPEYHATSAQISPEIKNKISHRGKALELMKLEIKKRLKQAFS